MREEIRSMTSNVNKYTTIYFPDKNQDKEVRNIISDHFWQNLSAKDVWKDFYVLRDIPLIDGDFTIFNATSPIITEKGKKILSPLLRDQVEFLPLIGKEEQFYIINVLTVINALDIDKTDADIYYINDNEDEGIDEIDLTAYEARFKHDHSLYKGIYFFKVPYVKNYIYYTKALKDLCIEHGLEGLEFSEQRLCEQF